MLARYFPTGLLGIGFTALMASFMSGMAGNVTAFNTVWTYDIYQSYIAPKMRRTSITSGWAASPPSPAFLLASAPPIGASKFNNIMDMLQLVFGFVNAPLFATFLLGMFWKRTTGHGAFFGLLSGTVAAALFHGLSLAQGETASLIKGGWVSPKFLFHSAMGQNFWMALVAWTACFLLTALISLGTHRLQTDKELAGLVYSLTPRQPRTAEPWYQQPVTLGILILIFAAILNIVFA